MRQRCDICNRTTVPEEVLEKLEDNAHGEEKICCPRCKDSRMRIIFKVGKFALVKWVDEVEPVEDDGATDTEGGDEE
jgi:hypothetical protein